MSPRWLIAACCGTLFAQAPEDLDIRTATIVSEGTPMTASVYSLKDNAGQKLPCVVIAHGWGGTAAALRPDAIPIARAGYYVAAFDYRGWGKSESRLIRVSGELKEVREVVDPIDFGTDWLNAIHWMAGEPQCNGSIGLWGSSFSGGLVARICMVGIERSRPHLKDRQAQVDPCLTDARPVVKHRDDVEPRRDLPPVEI